ncbi:hypothetical protein FNU77_08670 [Prescottella equi]|uniref:hypothetical protein n=1 Tax=Rhodococcus hoagii TaxID=43767 RepID=UPI001161E0EF|nr:hypothetical protein [Prescottella equi]QDP09782.1 hypothetical protein FNU77_08670 [Prescottella equi]
MRAVGARVDGQLALNGANLANPGGEALNLDGATVTGDVFAEEGFSVTGEVRAVGARVDGQLVLNGATLSNPGGFALSLSSSVIGTLILSTPQIVGTVDLTRTVVTDLVTSDDSVPGGRLVATGWQVTDIHGRIRTDRAAAARWLNTRPSGYGFTVQPWHALAAVYDRNGQPADARRMRVIAANKVTKHAPWYSKPLRWLYWAAARYGYFPLWAAVWLIAAVAAGTWLTSVYRADFVPTDKGAAHSQIQTASDGAAPAEITADVPCDQYPHYSCFDPVIHSLTNLIPTAIGTSKPDWAARSGAALVIVWGLPILRILCWLLTAVLLAGVTGLLKKA